MMNNRHSTPRQRPWLILLLFTAMLFMSMLACNLSSPPPPTVPPRLPTSTPQATLGISTQVPLELPTGIAAEAPSDPGIDTLLAQIDPNRLMDHVRALYGFQTRYINSTQTDPAKGIGAARQYIYDQLTAYSAQSQGRMRVWEHPFTLSWEDKETLQHNIVANLQGTESGAGVIIIGGHYDAAAYDVDATQLAPGADDNGTGIAAMLEIARIMAQTPHRATIIFIAFSAEEVGRVGSIRFIDEYLKQYNIDVRAVLTLDTIGNVNGPGGSVNDSQIRLFSDDDNNSISRQLSRVIQLVASTYVPELQIVVQPAGDREGRWGDHMSFTSQGYAAVRFIEAVQDPSRQNNSLDTIEWINPLYLTRSTEVTLATLAIFANGLQAPDNFTLRQSASDPENRTLVWTPIAGASGYIIALRQPGAITYNQVLNVGPTNSLTWSGFAPDRFEALTIATVDAAGRWGPFSPEFRLTQ
jgi:hypothetical protein